MSASITAYDHFLHPSTQFYPWVGPKYNSDGLAGTRLLVLGESHYGQSEDLRPGFTRDVIRRNVYQGRHSFFTVLTKLLLNQKAGFIRQKNREFIWDRIAFYNYVQGMAGTGARDSVPKNLWETSQEAFYSVVKAVRPNALLIVGKTLRKHLPDLNMHTATAQVETLTIPHVAWPGFSYDPWGGEVHRFLGAVNRKQFNTGFDQ